MSNEKKTAVPELRFAEFGEAGEWKLKKVRDALVYESSSLALNKLVFIVDGFPVYGADGLVGRIGSFAQASEYISILKDGSGVGRISLYPSKSSVLGTSGYLKLADESTFSLGWLYFFLQTVDFSVYVKGSGIPHLYYSDYSDQAVAFPTLPEQQKIAATLSSLDDLLTAQSAKLAALQAHKRGLMQGLFPAEGETVPKLRFAEFAKNGEWVEKSLSTIAELTSSKRIHLSDYVSSGVPFFRGKEISLLRKGKTSDDVLYISRLQYEGIKKRYGVPQIGDILITAVGTLANIYRVRDADEFYFKDGNLIWIRGINEEPAFLEVLLEFYRSDILASAIGSSQKALTMVELNKLVFKLPAREEQQKIAACLTSLDALIAAQGRKLDALRLHKKGLMQGLFPAASDETTKLN